MKTFLRLWRLAKPFIIPALILIGWAIEVSFNKDISNAIFLITFVLYLFLHGRQMSDAISNF